MRASRYSAWTETSRRYSSSSYFKSQIFIGSISERNYKAAFSLLRSEPYIMDRIEASTLAGLYSGHAFFFINALDVARNGLFSAVGRMIGFVAGERDEQNLGRMCEEIIPKFNDREIVALFSILTRSAPPAIFFPMGKIFMKKVGEERISTILENKSIKLSDMFVLCSLGIVNGSRSRAKETGGEERRAERQEHSQIKESLEVLKQFGIEPEIPYSRAKTQYWTVMRWLHPDLNGIKNIEMAKRLNIAWKVAKDYFQNPQRYKL